VLTTQPAMAPLWHACAAAVFSREDPEAFARTRVEMARLPARLVRAATHGLRELLAGESSPLIITVSYSSSVAATLAACAPEFRLRVICAEGRPRFEGRRLAMELANRGIDVTLVVDAAVTTRLSEAAAVVMGADAVTETAWMNKVGSFGLAAAASVRGVPVHVIAGRDKFVPRSLQPRLTPAPAAAGEVWEAPGAGVRVENPYFEWTPAELATTYLTEAGRLTPSDLPAVVARGSRVLTFLLEQMIS
jgi:translation initiation factor 2B subunit (eIF-2B alpha/beta/delta family)